MAEKKYTSRELEEYVTKLMTESEINASKQRERIDELKKENEKLTSEIASLKRKDKASARAITLAERKSKYIQDVTKSRCAIEIDRLTRISERFSGLFDKLEAEDQQQLQEFNAELKAVINTLSNLGEYIEDRKPLSDAEKNYISEKTRISLNDAVKSDLDDRFNKLMSEFKLKVGDSATRKRGRPRKSDQSILVEVNRVIEEQHKEELSEAEKQEVLEKLNEIFYTVKPTDQQKKKKGANKDAFDFDEALNPTESLADIFKDLK